MDVNVTYETLFDTLRKEKSSPELQDIEESFYDDVNNYISEKMRTYEETHDIKTEKQIQNIKKIVKEIFERRQKKLLMQAFSQGRTTNTIKFNTKLSEEQYFINNIIEIIQKHNILLDKTFQQNNTLVEKPKEVKKTTANIASDMIQVKFLTKLPKFLGKDLESYGPYEKEDTAQLPNQLAEILINKGRAKKV